MSRNQIKFSEDSEKTANFLKALAHPIRLEIIRCLQEGPKCVFEIEEHVGTTQSNISQHLAVMKNKGILQASRDGNQIRYSVFNWRIFQFLAKARDLLTTVPGSS